METEAVLRVEWGGAVVGWECGLGMGCVGGEVVGSVICSSGRGCCLWLTWEKSAIGGRVNRIIQRRCCCEGPFPEASQQCLLAIRSLHSTRMSTSVIRRNEVSCTLFKVFTFPSCPFFV